jgi:cell division protein FtsI (penicillin-binding protein 3)
MSWRDAPRGRAQVHVPEAPRDSFPLKRPAVKLEGAAKQVIEVGRNRLIITGALFALCFVVLGLRLFDLAVFHNDETASRGTRAGATLAARADIVDRNGVLLATNLETASLYADPSKVLDANEAATAIARVLPELSRADLFTKLSSGKSFVWIKRNLSPRQQWEVNALGVPGLAFQREERRVYPHGALAAHVLGFVDVDNKGLAGVEAYFDETLRDPARQSKPLQLSIDVRVQHALTDEVAKAVREFNAIGGAGLVMDVRTGEVLGMTSLPDFDPNDVRDASQDAKFNRVCLGVYEMGSTFKTFNTAMALDSGVASMSSSYDATHPIKIARFTISDTHAQNRVLTVPEIFMYSSNIGSVRMALDAGTQTQQAFMAKLGLLRRASIELPELGMPLVPNPWREINTMTIAFGHGLSVTPLHLATGVSAMVNGGVLMPATLVKADAAKSAAGTRVISARTSEEIRRLLRLVVMQGTGKKAEAQGYLVGGKTGTAEKVGAAGGYARKALLSSFVGAFPMTDPRYVVLVMIDEPQGNKETYGYATGGWVAAPAISRIVTRIGPMLGVPPVDENSPTIQEAMYIPVKGGGAE